MPKIAYEVKGFRQASLDRIKQANAIISEWQRQGYSLTLRQLYYQFVAKGWIPNRQVEYDNLGALISSARRAGLIDWNAIVDRTRALASLSHWNSPGEIVESAALGYNTDRWKRQPYRPEVWVEKQALAEIVARSASRNDVPYFSCRGYPSDSETWAAAQRLIRHIDAGQTPVIIHLGDHDPSGLDMTRDIVDKMLMFIQHHRPAATIRRASAGRGMRVHRIALNMEQVEQYRPPPNPAKQTDSRYQAYAAEFGTESWELDALDPSVLDGLIDRTIVNLRDERVWDEDTATMEAARAKLTKLAQVWEDDGVQAAIDAARAPTSINVLIDSRTGKAPGEPADDDDEEEGGDGDEDAPVEFAGSRDDFEELIARIEAPETGMGVYSWREHHEDDETGSFEVYFLDTTATRDDLRTLLARYEQERGCSAHIEDNEDGARGR